MPIQSLEMSSLSTLGKTNLFNIFLMIAVIGDIHGCFYSLKELIEKVKSKYPGIQIYCVGDLIDRGNYSFDVLEFIMAEKIRFTPGNHDYMFYYFVNFPSSEMGTSWLYNGYETTISSYENKFDKIASHLDFILEAPLFMNLNDCFISHAGISNYYKSIFPANFKDNLAVIENYLSKDITERHGILWTRGELLNIGKLQVVGHTRHDEVFYNKKCNTLYIDTSVYTGNKLSAVVVGDNKLVDIISVPTNPNDLN